MAIWTLFSTSVITLVMGVPALLAGIIERSSRALYRVGQVWVWLILKANRVKLRAVGVEKVMRDRSYVFIANHLSHLDSAAVAMVLPHVLRFVAKRSLARIPVFGWAIKLGRMIFIDRGDSAGAIETINQAVKDLRNGISAFFYAEGTRSETGRMRPFKKGGIVFAMKAKLPIVPITIIDSNRLLPKGSLSIKSGLIKVIVGDPVDTTEYTDENRDYLVKKIQDIISANLARYRTADETA
ncbi:MAG TPA: 1-acyl-sn-glycerol-3-phosphate acyltransferase [Spirochaetes bacterium]|nr:1-acyl-sn-glycerol-3-phosphate acyltransferase [Spirochaetota bacterium]